MRCIVVLTVTLLLNATAWADEFRLFSSSEVGPLNVKSEVVKSGKGSSIRATATNDSGVRILDVHFCVRSRKAKPNVCAATLGNIEIWQPGAAFYAEVNLPASVKLGSYVIDVALLIPDKGVYHVRRIYVDPLDGSDKDMARDQLMAAIVNTHWFELAGDRKSADATLTGRAETSEVGSESSRSAQAATAGGVVASRIVAIGGSVANGMSRESTKKIIDKAMILRLTFSGESIWAWDDSKDCRAEAKAKCAIDDLREFATPPTVPALR